MRSAENGVKRFIILPVSGAADSKLECISERNHKWILEHIRETNGIWIDKMQKKVIELEKLCAKVSQQLLLLNRHQETVRELTLRFLTGKIEAVLLDWPFAHLETIVAVLNKQKSRNQLLFNVRRSKVYFYVIEYLNPLFRLFVAIEVWSKCNEVTLNDCSGLKKTIRDFRMQKTGLLDRVQVQETIVVQLLDYLSSALRFYNKPFLIAGVENLKFDLDGYITKEMISAISETAPEEDSQAADNKSQNGDLDFLFVCDSEDEQATKKEETIIIELHK